MTSLINYVTLLLLERSIVLEFYTLIRQEGAQQNHSDSLQTDNNYQPGTKVRLGMQTISQGLVDQKSTHGDNLRLLSTPSKRCLSLNECMSK
jgi:hypothetical protein